ncbi:MAG: Do family serine endopeptidase [Pseudomonadota bacterium]
MNRWNRFRHLFEVTVFTLGFIFSLSPAAAAKSADETRATLDLRTAISKVAKVNIPAVVHIDVTRRQEIVNPMLPFGNDPFFRFFFDNPGMPRNFSRELKGLGSGMIMDSRGYILTNNHVVGNAADVEVLLSNGHRTKAALVGVDPRTDLAVIKIEVKEPLPYVTFGDSDKMDVGNWVIAIGHPRGLDQTVTQGIISAKHRRGITDPNSYQDFLQTDAAINPGNSGGPLLNLEGEVIGVNAAIASQSGGFEGIGFAIPSNMALYVAKGLIAQGKVTRGWLGISIQDLTPDLAGSLGLKTTKGALIADVVKDGPAHKAGIRRGDVVTAYMGKEILDSAGLRNGVAVTPVGKTAGVTVSRKGAEKEFSVRIGDLESENRPASASLRDRLGVEVREVNAGEAKRYQLPSNQGAVVVRIDPNGPLGKAGFEPGDIILEVNGQRFDDVKALAEFVESLKPDERIVLLGLDHGSGRTGYVQIMAN